MPPNNRIEDLFSVAGLVVVITGGGSGLGLYAARALDANGAKAVYIVGRREEVLKKAAATAVNGNIIPIQGDVSDKDSLAKVVEHVRQKEGFVNLLFANAGVSGPGHAKSVKKDDGSKPTLQEFQTAMLKPSMEEFTQVGHVNVTSVFYTVMSFLDLLHAGNQKRNVPQESQVLVTSSIAGFSRQISHGFSYSTSKAAVTHLVKNLSTTFSQNGFHVRVNSISPGLYPSEMTETNLSGVDKWSGGDHGAFPDAKNMPKEACPAERTGSEEDFAGTILFMASRAGAYLNGECMVSDGGRLSQLPAAY
ncbi:related to gluconate 5-dehydrogenase [Ramularia collo-cygni]|uniref:Related to gluconate 5-dehydrogenase n=1 Tax=Ramularia collo-cygni TaxID=112498 RepID=A0A2D3UUT3_9PEZI|nr:related to gluconate 5-dehydrogenase [Ramularia collo-cygni]CZT18978.1 related to gluconate 5-dehydrogenase [Ramularia collo-cygni]